MLNLFLKMLLHFDISKHNIKLYVEHKDISPAYRSFLREVATEI